MFDIGKMKEAKTLNSLLAWFDEHNIEYKSKPLRKGSSVSMVVVDNLEIDRLSRLYKDSSCHGKGKHKFYFFGDTALFVYNYYGWQGNFESDSTSNHVSFLSGNREPFEALLAMDCDSISIRDIEKEICNVIGEVIPTRTKYKDFEEFAVKKKHLLKKYVLEIFGDKVLFLDANFYDDFIDDVDTSSSMPVFPENVEILSKKEFDVKFKAMYFRINKNLIQKTFHIKLRFLLSLFEEEEVLSLFYPRANTSLYMFVGFNKSVHEDLLPIASKYGKVIS